MLVQHHGKMRAAELCEALAGDDADPGGHRLEHHGDEIGEHDDPEQQVAETCAALDVGGEVAWVHVGDRGDHGGPGERQEAPQPAATPGQCLAPSFYRLVGEASALHQSLAHAATTIL